jgi:N-acetylglucosamine kinase-like BadF-type ATPase
MSGAVVGLDVGGSKTQGVRVESGRVVAEATVGSANISSVGPEEAARQLLTLARQLQRPAGAEAVAAVCVGAAGVESPQAGLRLQRLVEDAFPAVPVQVVHDTRLVLAAAGLRTGVVVISGTGSATWGRNAAGEEARASGWGYLLGDDGSAFGVIRSALRHALDRLDAGDAQDALTDRLLKTCGVTGAGELLEFFYREPSRREWAARSSVVFDLLAEGDPAAGTIVTEAAADLARPAAQVARRLGLGGPVVMAGGLLSHQPALRSRLEHDLTGHGLHDVRLLDGDPVHGAVRLAQEMLDREKDG